MNVEEIRKYCITKPGVTEILPFNDTALAFKATGKMFALLDLSDEGRGITLKCDPVLTVELRERHSSIIPGYHMDKKHWNTVLVDGSVPDREIFSWIDHSYKLVVRKKK